jgi:hypothetical protein
MLCWILIVGGLLIMMGQHDRSELLFCSFRLFNSYFATGKSVFFSVNSTDACVFSELMRMVQLPPV